jgi:hypothetical protein
MHVNSGEEIEYLIESSNRVELFFKADWSPRFPVEIRAALKLVKIYA